MLKVNWQRLLLAGLLFLFTSPSFAQQNDFDAVTQRVVSDMLDKANNKVLKITVADYMGTLQADGTWKDINYKDNSVAIWQPAMHLSRIEDFALAFSRKNSGYQNNETLYTTIIKALRGWNQADPICKNWWYNQINNPQALGQIMLLMQGVKPVPPGLRDSLLKKMDRGDMYKQTGANEYDVALHNMYSALLTHNITLMDSAISQCFEPIVLTNRVEGVRYDYSYLQHGPQLQVASYGSVFLVGEYKLAAFVSGTRWQLTNEKAKVLTGFLNHTFLTSIRYKYFDFSVMGRGFSRKDSGYAGALPGMHSAINVLKSSNPGMAADLTEYDDAVKRASGTVPASYRVKAVHNQYWTGDYTQHVEPGYLITVRANSTRTRRTETGNGENLFGRYMSDGATNIQRSGSEYFNIFPVWEFDKIPGVTSRDFAQDRAAVRSWDQPGTTNFTGGVSDGLHGASTYTLDFDSVQAKKAWFFFDKQVICLGAGIQSAAPEHVTTTINQCWSRGDLITDNVKQAYWQDSIAYYVKPGNPVLFENSIQTGNWKNINTSQSADLVSGKIFKLWIDHGTHPNNGSYAYAVVPGISAAEFNLQNPFNDLTILSNTPDLQAVSSAKLNMVQLVFYKAGSLKHNGINIIVNEPCVLMVEKHNTTNLEVFVADPSQKLATIKVSVNNIRKEITLPEKAYAGSTVNFLFPDRQVK